MFISDVHCHNKVPHSESVLPSISSHVVELTIVVVLTRAPEKNNCPNLEVFQPANVQRSVYVRNLFMIRQKTIKPKKYWTFLKLVFTDCIVGQNDVLCYVLSYLQNSLSHLMDTLSNLLWVCPICCELKVKSVIAMGRGQHTTKHTTYTQTLQLLD